VFRRDERIKRHYARGACNQILFSSKTKLAFSACRWPQSAWKALWNIAYHWTRIIKRTFPIRRLHLPSLSFFLSLLSLRNKVILMILPDCARAAGKWANVFEANSCVKSKITWRRLNNIRLRSISCGNILHPPSSLLIPSKAQITDGLRTRLRASII